MEATLNLLSSEVHQNDKFKTTGETIEVAGQVLKWAHDFRRDIAGRGCGVLYHALLDAEGTVLGSHYHREEAIKQAKFHLYPKLDRMTPEQFREVAMVIPVVRGCSANSSRTMGRQSENRYLVEDTTGDHIAMLRAEALRAYDLKEEDDRPDDRDKFPEMFITAILGGVEDHFDIELKCGKDTRPIILINTDSRAVLMKTDSIMEAAYGIYTAPDDDPVRDKPRCSERGRIARCA